MLVCPHHVMFSAALRLCHAILPSEYEAVLAVDDIVNVAVVLKDTRTKERFLAAQEFSMSSPQITIQVHQHPVSCITRALCSLLVFSPSTFQSFTLISLA